MVQPSSFQSGLLSVPRQFHVMIRNIPKRRMLFHMRTRTLEKIRDGRAYLTRLLAEEAVD
eukprot:CAMPEP_0184689560 /NCGR_PEP_ID=MMETSP0312-20130426/30725_1 /TAXON_ID=31354 /ORGANISM="Compsopogon coeruleus, Strain SAG 36.94" /LENGTH=59 /DNA_ID=CAMNT_0027146925 /DNA_START=204 /DNA_END=383 /DNA_ORIENTATION=+